MARRKQGSVHVPADAAEAELMIAEYTALERDRLLVELAAQEAIAQLKTLQAKHCAEIEAEAQPLFAGLKAWWEAGGHAEIGKGKRSAPIGTATIGIRLTPPAVKLARKVKLDDVVAWLFRLRWTRAKNFIRTKHALDKEAVIKAIRAEPELAKTFADHLTIEQKDEFFIDTGLDADALKKDDAAS